MYRVYRLYATPLIPGITLLGDYFTYRGRVHLLLMQQVIVTPVTRDAASSCSRWRASIGLPIGVRLAIGSAIAVTN